MVAGAHILEGASRCGCLVKKQDMAKKNSKALLKEAALKLTSGRLAVLHYLASQKRPVGVEAIHKAVKGVNKVTLYRMMQDFEAAGLLLAYDLGHGHSDYELADRPHHHHLVCQDCGDVEDIFSCESYCEMEALVMKSSQKFEQVKKQAITFFGICHRCAS